MVILPPYPDEVAYNPLLGNEDREGEGIWYDGYHNVKLQLYRRSHVDGSLIPEAAETLNYRRGTLDVKLREDCYWASDTDQDRSPVPIVADDWVDAAWYIERCYQEEAPFADVQKTGERSFQIQYEEAYSADYALSDQLTERLHTGYNAALWRPQIEAYQDASTDDRREEIRDTIGATELETPHPMTNTPFRVSGTEDDRWILTLRDDENQALRWVDDLTFDTVELVVRDSIEAQTRAFRDGQTAFAATNFLGRADYDWSVIDVDVPFETDALTVPQRIGVGCYVLNLGRPPADNVHFRRALAYLLDREAHLARFMEGDQLLTGFNTADRERAFLSAEFLEMLRNGPHDNYGYAEVKQAAAIAELEAGGFERDSEGRWLHQSGDRAGEPISLEIHAFEWDILADHAGPFLSAVREVGIDAAVVRDDAADFHEAIENRPITFNLWGGRFPHETFTHAFSGLYPFERPVGLPDRWEGPPVGEFATPPAAATDATETYDVARMLDALTTTGWDIGQDIIDRLAWVYNQSMVTLPVGHLPNIYTTDTADWTWPTPAEDHPSSWGTVPRRTLWWKGHVQARRGE